MQSKYLSQFDRVKNDYKLQGNRLLVEQLPKEEIKSAGGLILAATQSDHRSTLDQNRACLAIVLAVGKGYYSEETGEDVAIGIEVGNIVLISTYGLRSYSTFPGVVDYVHDTVALIRDSDVTQVWTSFEDYNAFKGLLADGAEKEG